FERTVMRLEKLTEMDRLLRLNNMLALLVRAERIPPEARRHLLTLYDFGTTDEFKFIIINRVGQSIEDLLYHFGVPFNARTVHHIAAESLRAIREVHAVGFLLRNVRPADFHIGLSPFGEKNLYIGSYNRVFNQTSISNGKPKKPREHVCYPYAPLYASRARLREEEMSVRDDYESW
ncbi:hypothetical protein PFISCL1PPCAC_5377, partial [Pristionchus fissidentatus]